MYRMRIARQALLGVVLTGSLVAATVWLLPYVGVPVSAGPLERVNAHGTALDDFRVGDRFTYGLNTVTLTGADSATITDVQVVGLDDGIRFLGARLGGPNRDIGSWQILPSWPPVHPGVDLRPLNTPITAKSADPIGWELFLGFEITRPGTFTSEGWQVTYRSDGRTYRSTIPAFIRVCVPRRGQPKPPCPVPNPI
jgi:hypothetical protein